MAKREYALVRHSNGIARALASEPERFDPVLQKNRSTGGVVKAVAFLKGLYGTVSGESRVEEEAFAVLGPVVPTLICRIVGNVK